jgi:YggT family protein
VGLFFSNLLFVALIALWLLIFGRVLLSWFDPAGRSPLAAFVVNATEPILGPVRRALPQTGMLDLSPMVVLIALSLVVGAIGR